MELPEAPVMAGVAPPMSGPPTSIPGPAKASRDKMMQAARLLFDVIAEAPQLAKDINEIIEKLTTVIRQSAEAPALPGGGSEGSAGLPSMDRTPLGPPPGAGAMASPAGAHSAAVLSQLMGRG